MRRHLVRTSFFFFFALQNNNRISLESNPGHRAQAPIESRVLLSILTKKTRLHIANDRFQGRIPSCRGVLVV